MTTITLVRAKPRHTGFTLDRQNITISVSAITSYARIIIMMITMVMIILLIIMIIIMIIKMILQINEYSKRLVSE